MKICFLLSTFVYDGIKRSVVHFANAMQEMGHEVWVGALHDWPGKVSLRSELRLPDERVISWDGLGQGKREWAIYQFFRRQRFDVVHTNTIKMNHAGRWMAILARVPCIVGSEDNLCLNRSWKTRMEDRILARLSHAVVMISHAVAKSFLETEGLPPEKVRVVYYGLPLERFRAQRKTPAELQTKRAGLGIPAGPTVVCAARLHAPKSLETLVETARIVVDRLPDAQFLLAGDGEERAALEALRDSRRLQDHFHFLGAREDIYDIMQLGDVVTLCSLWEGLGFSLMEGMALGKPLVGTDVTGINEIVIHNRNGLLVPARSPDKLAGALVEILSDPAKAHQLSARGEEILSERFDVRRNAHQLLDLYGALLAR